MNKVGAVLLTAAVLAWLMIVAVPAQAETFVDTQSFVNSSGNTVTVTDTYEINGSDVVLVSRDMTETRPDGAVLVTKAWDFYPSGAVKSSDEMRNSSVAPTTIHRDYAEDGTLLFQRSEMSLNGELALVALETYNADGYFVSQEVRQLITLADGTKVWEVTVTSYALDGSVTSETVTQYPSSHNFDAPPSAEQPPANQPPANQPPADQPPADQPPADQPPSDDIPVIDQPPADQPPADEPPAEQPPADQPPADEPPAEQPPADEPPADEPPADQPAADERESRPGYGNGDKNHVHTGPPGQGNGNGGNGNGGNGNGGNSNNHNDKDDKGKSKDKDK